MLKKMALSGIANLFAERMPFNKLIGMQVTHYDFEKVELRIKMDDKLIGNPVLPALHGGSTAALLELTAVAQVAALQEHASHRLEGAARMRDAQASLVDRIGSLDALARQAGTNANTLQRHFRAVYGTTVFDFVREHRLQRARHALEQDGLTVGQAALVAGYNSAANFATAYRKRFGMPPKLARARI